MIARPVHTVNKPGNFFVIKNSFVQKVSDSLLLNYFIIVPFLSPCTMIGNITSGLLLYNGLLNDFYTFNDQVL